tara:strand:+ start:4506 stop:4892 length:387 start_codon:yes stop_codon:yes gene_type:complete
MKFKKLKVNFKDKRGKITDIFYKKNIQHIAIIDSKPNVRRGDHYHKKTTQWMYITKGSLEYWYKPLKSKSKAKKKLLRVGDLVETPPNEMHALKIGKKGNQFIVFTIGKRGGKDYENDTYRFKPSLIK